MNIDQIVADELERLKPQMTRLEWFTLQDVLRVSLYRIVKTVNAENSAKV